MNKECIVCFLRAVNVVGSNLIKMADLQALFRKLGFTSVETYLQSGNVIFSYDGKLKEADLKNLIISGISKKFGLDIRVVLRNKKEIEQVFRSNPFLINENADITKLYVTLLDSDPGPEMVEILEKSDFAPERFHISGREAYLYMPAGYGRAKLNNNFLEKKLGRTATTRNWKTISAIRDILEGQS